MSKGLPPSPFNVITGEPRACLTLMENLLNQNPAFCASDTSPVPYMIHAVSAIWTATDELKGELGTDRDGVEEQVRTVARGIATNWHERRRRQLGKKEGSVIFDNSRGWTSLLDTLWHTYENARVIVCVRDPRDVVASTEWALRDRGLLDPTASIRGRRLLQKLDRLLHPDTGIIGSAMEGLMDMIDRKRFDDPRVLVIKAEELAKGGKHTAAKMKWLYGELGYPYFEGHQYDDVENTAGNPDHLNFFSYPHDGCGKIKPKKLRWFDCFGPHIGNAIINKYKLYCEKFDYEPVEIKT